MTVDYGPNSVAVVALIERCRNLSGIELDRLATAMESRAPWWAPWRATAMRDARDAWRAESSRALDVAEKAAQGAGRATAWDAAMEAVESAGNDAVRRTSGSRLDGMWALAWMARMMGATDAALALVVRDLITETQFAALTKGWRDAGLPVPDTTRGPSKPTRFQGVFGEPENYPGKVRDAAPELDEADLSVPTGNGTGDRRSWSDLGPGEHNLLAEFLLAVNSEVAFADGRMTAKEADVEPIFQRILARSRGDLIRQALFHLHDNYDRLGGALADEAASSGQRLASYGYATSRLKPVADVLAHVDQDEARRYLMAVWFTGVATAEADGPFFGPKMSPEERESVDAIVLPLAAYLGYGEPDILRWAKEGAG